MRKLPAAGPPTIGRLVGFQEGRNIRGALACGANCTSASTPLADRSRLVGRSQLRRRSGALADQAADDAGLQHDRQRRDAAGIGQGPRREARHEFRHPRS